MQFLQGLTVDCEYTLFDGIAELLVTLAHTGVNYAGGVEAGLYGAAHLVAGCAVCAQAVTADYLQDLGC